MSVFERYAPFVQDFIFQNGWDSLRAIQVAAGEAIFDSDQNVLLTASTASGKTEAAFFPILTLMNDHPPQSIGVLYICPLKALINDQFDRLNDLCREADIPVWHWHGDVSQSHKNKMLAKRRGILQITPESLEAMLIHKHAFIPSLFCDLRFVVIDEVHSLMRGDRGAQTMCLIERLSKLAGADPRIIGLSATVGQPETMGKLISRCNGRKTVIPAIEAQGVRWRLSLDHFYITDSRCSNQQERLLEEDQSKDKNNGQNNNQSAAEYNPLHNADAGIKYIFDNTCGKKCLVFVNSREECEAVTATLHNYSKLSGEPDRFLIHHGNLSASFRESAEQIMKDEEKYMTTVTTSTLELGIDIGRLERAFQVNAPATVSSFLQRMGRTGRRGQPQEMLFVIRQDVPDSRAMLPATLPWQLLQSIALVQLYLEKRWVEPPVLDRLPYSLLYHQTMSTLASCGEMRPAALAAAVLKLSSFSSVTKEDYLCLLRHLLSTGHIQKTEEGGLIVGLNGERQINSFKFYAVFKDSEEYSVKNQSQELGTVVLPPPAGEKLAIAGRVWEVQEIDHKRRQVFVKQVEGQVPAFFGLCPGDIHTQILQQMKTVLASDVSYPYVKKNAAERLLQARTGARNSGLINNPLINLGGNMWCLFPWLGTYAFLALERLIKLKCAPELGISGLESSRPYFMQFKMTADARQFYKTLAKYAKSSFEPEELIYKNEVPIFDKYDEFLPPELVIKGFARSVLDINGMKARILEWEEQFLEQKMLEN